MRPSATKRILFSEDGEFARKSVSRFVAQFLGLRKEDVVLDLGGGSGRHAVWVKEITSSVVEMLDPNTRAGSTGIPLHCFPAEEHRAALCRRYSAIYSVNVVHHLSDRGVAFRNCWSYSRNGRILLITASPRDIVERPINRFFPRAASIDLDRYPPIEVLVEELRDSGWQSPAAAPVELGSVMPDESLLHLCRLRAWSTLQLLPRKEVEAGIRALERFVASNTGSGRRSWPQIRTAVFATQGDTTVPNPCAHRFPASLT